MSDYPELEKLEPYIRKCVMCGGCQAGCPTYALSRHEQDTARGKALLADSLLKGELQPSEELAKKFDHCLTCMNCVEVCPAGAEPVKIITAARSEIRKNIPAKKGEQFLFGRVLPVKSLFSLFAKLLALGAKIYSLIPPFPGLPFVKQGQKKSMPPLKFFSFRGSQTEKATPRAPVMRIAYFTGCMDDRAYHDTAYAVTEVLRKAGAEVLLVKDEVCCGAPAFFSGDRESARQLAEKNLKQFGDLTVDAIVTSCATCGSVLKEVYPELLGEKAEPLSSKVTDFNKLLMEKLWDNLVFKKGNTLQRVTWHDPCHLNRGMKVASQPRELLKKLPGIEYVEMPEASLCCGGAGSFAMKYQDDSLSIGKRKADSIKETEAVLVATGCPSCRMQLDEIAGRYVRGVRAVHPAVLLLERLE